MNYLEDKNVVARLVMVGRCVETLARALARKENKSDNNWPEYFHEAYKIYDKKCGNIILYINSISDRKEYEEKNNEKYFETHMSDVLTKICEEVI